MFWRLAPHVWESVEVMALSFGEEPSAARREMAVIVLVRGWERRVERMLEPTRPVQPTTAAVVAMVVMTGAK